MFACAKYVLLLLSVKGVPEGLAADPEVEVVLLLCEEEEEKEDGDDGPGDNENEGPPSVSVTVVWTIVVLATQTESEPISCLFAFCGLDEERVANTVPVVVTDTVLQGNQKVKDSYRRVYSRKRHNCASDEQLKSLRRCLNGHCRERVLSCRDCYCRRRSHTD